MNLSIKRQGAAVAVVIAARNAAATIGRAISSALREPEAAEIVVIDDGSTDETRILALAHEDGSGRLKVISSPQSQGPSAARNRAISATRAPLIAVLDADDLFLPGRLGKLVKLMGDADFAADDLLLADEGSEGGPFDRLIGDPPVEPVTFAHFVAANITSPGAPRREWGYLKPLMRRDFLERTGLAYDQKVRLGEDFLLYARALAAGAKFKLVEPCGYVSVQRPGSLSHSHSIDDLRGLLSGSRRFDAPGLLDQRDSKVLEQWRLQLQRKLHYREVLELRRAKGIIPAIWRITTVPQHASYVLGQTLGDKLRRDRTTGTFERA